MKKQTPIFIALLITILCTNLSAQDFKWFQNQGSSLEDQSWTVAVDSNNNIFNIGFFRSKITFGNITKSNKGGRDHFIVKYDNSGSAVWVQTIASNIDEYGYRLALCLDKDGNVYVSSAFSGSCTFSSANNSNKTVSSNGGFDIYIAKYDNAGNLLWVKTYGSTGEDVGYGIACDDSSNVYTIGKFANKIKIENTVFTSGGGWDVFVTKHSENGNLLWVKQGTGPADDEGVCISVDTSHNVFIGGNGGYSNNSITFNNISSQSSGYNTAYIAKLDINGDCQWLESIYSDGGENTEKMTIDKTGNIYITGQHGSQVTAESANGNNYNGSSISGTHNMFVARYDTDGNLKWFTSEGGSNGRTQGMAICMNRDHSKVIASGSTASSLTLGNYSNNFVGADDYFISTLDTSGKFDWSLFGGSSGWDRVHGNAVDKSDNLYSCGLFENACNINGKSYNTSGDIDGFLMKYGPSVSNINYLTSTKKNYNLVISPNPNNGVFSVSLDIDMNANITIQTYDMTGKLLYNNFFKAQVGLNNFLINVQDNIPNSYLVKINVGDKFYSTKIMNIQAR